jgi:hypothetical protein
VLLAKTTATENNFVVNTKLLEAPYTTTTTSFALPNIPVIFLPQSSVNIKIAENALRSNPQYLLTETEENIVVENFDAAASDALVLETTNFAQSLLAPGVELETVISRWQISTRAAPQPVITALLPTLEMLGEPVFLELFGVKQREPYATFKNLWFDHPNAVYRLIGLTLALIYRTEEARNHG